MKLVLWRPWLHLSYVHPLTSQNQFHCTRLYFAPFLAVEEHSRYTKKKLSNNSPVEKAPREGAAGIDAAQPKLTSPIFASANNTTYHEKSQCGSVGHGAWASTILIAATEKSERCKCEVSTRPIQQDHYCAGKWKIISGFSQEEMLRCLKNLLELSMQLFPI